MVNCASIPEPPGSSILDHQRRVPGPAGRPSVTVFHLPRGRARSWSNRGLQGDREHQFVRVPGDYGGTGYPAGKGAVNGLTLAIAAELREHSVHANVVSGPRPGSHPADYEARSADCSGVDCSTGSWRHRWTRNATGIRRAAVRLPGQRPGRGISGQMLVAQAGSSTDSTGRHRHCWSYRDHADAPPWTPARNWTRWSAMTVRGLASADRHQLDGDRPGARVGR